MIIKRTFVFWLLLCLACSAQAQSVTSGELEQRNNLWYLIGSETPFSGEVKDPGELTGRIESGHREGRWTAWHSSGNVSWETDYETGVMTYHAMYYPDGSARFEGKYVQGRLDGIAKAWYAHGTLQSETTYRLGQRNGERNLWGPEGALLYSTRYTSGQLDGPAIWWYDNGQQRWATYYKQGKKWGVWTQWARDGRILGQSDWKDNRMVSRQSRHGR